MNDQLNENQKQVLNTIIANVENQEEMEKFKKNNVFFVEGEGGTGKSFTINVKLMIF